MQSIQPQMVDKNLEEEKDLNKDRKKNKLASGKYSGTH